MRKTERSRHEATSQVDSRVPTFGSIEEEAEFWDTHDSTEFEDEFEDVMDVQFVRQRSPKAVTVRLDPDTFADLAQQAKERGMPLSGLARLWIVEALRSRARGSKLKADR